MSQRLRPSMRIVFAMLVAAMAALVITLWRSPFETSHTAELARFESPSGLTASEERIAEIESQLREERRARRALEAQVEGLATLIATLEPPTGPAGHAGNGVSPSSGIPNEADMTEFLADLRERWGPPGRDENQAARLIAAGFDPEAASRIMERESELKMEALQRSYEARQTGQAYQADSPQTVLREELGDDQYEQYREATGRPTRVRIDRVLVRSPAEAAGLSAGDEIVRYDNQRVFDMGELHRLTLGGEPGQRIALDVLRGGEEIRVVLPRGPIGIESSGMGHPR